MSVKSGGKNHGDIPQQLFQCIYTVCAHLMHPNAIALQTSFLPGTALPSNVGSRDGFQFQRAMPATLETIAVITFVIRDGCLSVFGYTFPTKSLSIAESSQLYGTEEPVLV